MKQGNGSAFPSNLEEIGEDFAEVLTDLPFPCGSAVQIVTGMRPTQRRIPRGDLTTCIGPTGIPVTPLSGDSAGVLRVGVKVRRFDCRSLMK